MRKAKRFYVLLCILMLSVSAAMPQRIISLGLFGGAQYGGPLPDHTPSNASGKAYIGPHAGISLAYHVTGKLSVQTRIFYSYTNILYGQQTGPRDTLYPLHMNDSSVFLIPTSYQSQVYGRMRFHKMTLTLGVTYKIFKIIRIGIEPYLSFLVAGSDTILNHVIVGDHFIDDNLHVNNSNYLSKLDFGLGIYADFAIYKGLYAAISGTRSFLNIYNSGYYTANSVNKAKFYQTYFYLSLGYRFLL